MNARIALIAPLVVLATSFPLAARDSEKSFDLAVPLALLEGVTGTLTLNCEAVADGHDMMTSLEGQGRRGRWESTAGDDRVTAVRRGDRFRLRVWEGSIRRLEVVVPWEVAECLFGAGDSEQIEVDIAALRESGGFSLELAGDGLGDINISLD